MNITKYMDFINPTEEFVGKRRAIQGFGIYDKYAIILYHTGVCALYDLETRQPEPLDVIKNLERCLLYRQENYEKQV